MKQRGGVVAVKKKGRSEETGCNSSSRDCGGETSSSSSDSSSSPTASLSSLESLSLSLSTSTSSLSSSSLMPTTVPRFPGTPPPSEDSRRIEKAATSYRTNRNDIVVRSSTSSDSNVGNSSLGNNSNSRNRTPTKTMNMAIVRRRNSTTTNGSSRSSGSSSSTSKRPPPPPLTLWVLVYSTALFMIVLVYTETYLWQISSSLSASQSPTSYSTATSASFGLPFLPLFNTSSLLNSTSSATSKASISDSGRISEEEDDDKDDSEEEDEEENQQERQDVEREEDETNNSNIIHIVHSRFMQNQPQLVELGRARLLLLKQFFLKSLTQQSSKNFMVVIKTDPQLDPRLKQELIDALQYSNLTHVLIASNNNPKSMYQEMKALRDEQSTMVVNGTQIWSGSLPDVFSYLRLSNDSREDENDNGNGVRVMETRLDADDGLHVMYIEDIQADATEKYDFNPMTWRLWCIGNHIEWQYNTLWKTDPADEKKKKKNFDEHENEENEEDVGTLVALQATYCVTAGLTIGFPGDVASMETMPSTQKHERLQKIRMCSDGDDDRDNNENESSNDTNKNKKSLHGGTRGMRSNMALEDDGNDEAMDTSDDGSQGKDVSQSSSASSSVSVPPSANCRSVLPLGLAAIRARTPTSAGMLNVVVNGTSFNRNYLKGAHQQREIQHKLWYVSKRLFGGFSKKKARTIHTYFDSHIRDIARENLDGQCTHGHSCKNSSQILLRSIMEGKSLAEANAAAAAAAAAGKKNQKNTENS